MQSHNITNRPIGREESKTQMQFTTVYTKKTVNRRRCMLCNVLINDGEMAFFKGVRGQQGKAVHDACREKPGFDNWYSRDCSIVFKQRRNGNWYEFVDPDLKKFWDLKHRLRVVLENKEFWKDKLGTLPSADADKYRMDFDRNIEEAKANLDDFYKSDFWKKHSEMRDREDQEAKNRP